MPDPAPQTIPFPPEGFRGIQALIALGSERLKKLAELQVSQPLELSFSSLTQRLAQELKCDRRDLQLAFMNALIPLNAMRRNFELAPPDFLNALDRTISERAPEDWKKEYLESWKDVLITLPAFFQPDNFFSQASKAFDLLSERPALFQSGRILTELRPIYDEATTKTLSVLQTNTFVLDYWDGERIRSVHVTLDITELQALEDELKRVRKKIDVSQREARERGTNLVLYGETLEGGAEE